MVYSGAGSVLSLSSLTNAYTGGTVINSGTVTLTGTANTNVNAVLGGTSGGITLNGGQLRLAGVNVSAARIVTVNGVGSSLFVNKNNNFTTTEKLTGAGTLGTLDGGGSGTLSTYSFNSTANDFTGRLIGTNTIINVNSFADGSSNIVLDGATFNYGTGAAAAANLSTRAIELSGTTNGATINNNNTTAANTLSIGGGLLVTGVGNKTLTLAGANTGNNSFSGIIADGPGSVISLAKSGAGTWVLGSNNTYTGQTTVSAGTLRFANGAMGSIGAINASGGTLQWGTGNTQDISSRLAMTAATTTTLDTNGNDVTFATAFGGNTTGALTKNGAGSLVLNGANTYTGITSISAGKLFINGSLSDTSVALTANSGATLGGTGTIGRNVTIATGGRLEFNLSTAATSHDRLDISSGRSFAFSGASVLTITSSGGASPGTYTLITGGNNITGVAPATLNLPVGWAATVSISGNNLLLNVTSTGGPGPVASFQITGVSSQAVVGTTLTGITITARDVANATATSFSGTVTFGGTGGFTGTSASFTNGVLTNVSVTPTVAGSNLTFTVDNGAGKTGSTIIATIQTQYQLWAVGGVAFDADTNGDGIKNGMAWLLGALDPSANALDKLPQASRNGTNLRLTFRCLKSTKRGTAQVKVQSSGDLGASDPWTSHEAAVPDGDLTVNGVIFDTTDDGDFINVIADIPAAGANRFGRLQAIP